MASNALETQGTQLRINTTGTTFVLISEITDFDGFGGSAAVIDVTSLDSTSKEKRMGLQDWGQFSFNFNHLPADAGQVALQAAKASRAATKFELETTDGTIYEFTAFALNKGMSGGVDQALKGSATLEITGDVVEAA